MPVWFASIKDLLLVATLSLTWDSKLEGSFLVKCIMSPLSLNESITWISSAEEISLPVSPIWPPPSG